MSTPMPDSPAAGRPRAPRVSRALTEACLAALAENGFARTTVADVASRAHTSKQAIYRRWPDKQAMAAGALRQALASLPANPPERTNVAADLFAYLMGIITSLQTTPLGGALRAVLPLRIDTPEIARVLAEIEDGWRLTLRQILIATPFEAAMETRIDLLTGLIVSGGLLQDRPLSRSTIADAVELVLGLRAPRTSNPTGI